MLGLLLFGSALFLAGARLCYNWVEKIPSMDPEGFGAIFVKKLPMKVTVSCWRTQRVIIGLVQIAKPQAFTHALVQ